MVGESEEAFIKTLRGTRPVDECWELSLEFAQKAIKQTREVIHYEIEGARNELPEGLPKIDDPAVESLARCYLSILNDKGLVGL
jgi:hypothetical protein